MPLGRTHEKIQIGVTFITTLSAPLLLIGVAPSMELSEGAVITAAAFVGCLSAIIFTPDLIDIDQDTIPEKRIRTVPVIGWIVATIYDGISKLIPHRGISHVPIIGTAITLAIPWLVIIPFGIYVSWSFVLWLFVAKCWADLWHIVPDIITHELKEMF